ncbi:zinc D-Ala-D-Ala carboxypeptidase [Cladorrhinum samala]|uniref:Zinc D-Ala-D-Ala carboxypeptidase n=1 Tax=Cladorrhinum samala TaxID=585594 RepID=A0AAV9HW58_9PEZI|nr:zinc D-Ala-D-Ala carboxypeptidase [Cladorrhinum samala]
MAGSPPLPSPPSSFLLLLLSTGNPATAHPTASSDNILAVRADGYCDTPYTRYIAPNSWRISYPSLSGSSGNNCIMNVGARGSGVKSVQEAINRCYGGNLDADSKYGELTKKEVKKVQQKIGVAQDGIWGPKTGAKMKFWGTLNRPDRPDLPASHGCVSLS